MLSIEHSKYARDLPELGIVAKILKEQADGKTAIIVLDIAWTVFILLLLHAFIPSLLRNVWSRSL